SATNITPLPLGSSGITYQRPMQLSPGGAIVSMGDASTRSVSGSISLGTWQAVTDPANTTTVGSDWTQGPALFCWPALRANSHSKAAGTTRSSGLFFVLQRLDANARRP